MLNIVRGVRSIVRAGAEMSNCVECVNYAPVSPGSQGYGRCLAQLLVHPGSKDGSRSIYPQTEAHGTGCRGNFTPIEE